MNLRIFAGNLIAYVYNEWAGRLPSHLARRTFLHRSLKGLGEGTSVQLRCRFLNPRKVSFGERNVINFGCLFDGRKFGIQTGNDVSIGPEASILTLGHDPRSPDFADRGGEVLIGDRAWIGYRALILPGVTIGEGAVVGAGAVVARDVAPYTIVAGNPAKVIGERRRDLSYELNYRPFLG